MEDRANMPTTGCSWPIALVARSYRWQEIGA